jgi:hypothetical protein
MKDIVQLLINCLSAITGGILFMDLAYKWFNIDDKLSIWWTLFSGAIGAIMFWMITDKVLLKIFKLKGR